jgi:carbonic anhydrase
MHDLPKKLPHPLKVGYGKFRTFKYARHAQRYLELAVKSQKPSTMVIACCDSRAAPETIFDASAGELFVVRNVANLVPPYAPDGQRHSTSAALEFAVHELGVQHIVVMGHSHCGGIAAAAGTRDPLSGSDFIGKWMSDVGDVIAHVPCPEGGTAHDHLQAIERASVVQSLANLQSFPWISARENTGALTLHGVWFDVARGELHVYEESSRTWREVMPVVG